MIRMMVPLMRIMPLVAIALAVFLVCPWAALAEAPATAPATPGTQPAQRVARLVYASGKTSECFSDAFLAETARQTKLDLAREMAVVDLGNDDLFAYPFVVMAGEGAFELSPREVEQLRAYVERGGFVLASAGCANKLWSDSFRAAVKKTFSATPNDKAHSRELRRVPPDHALFHSLFDLKELRAKQATKDPVTLEGVEIDGRLAVVFSSLGLNDTPDTGGKCCCCGGNEVLEARLVNANILAYVLLH